MIGRVISQYRILEKLGEGGMGEVYLAGDTTLGRKVALKFLPASFHEDAIAHQRFIREARSAAALEHPYICNIKEINQTDEGQDFIVMECVPGKARHWELRPTCLPNSFGGGGEVVDPRTDIFSFGIILYELLAGGYPFRKSRQAATIGAILHEHPHPLTGYVEEVPEGLQQTMSRMLAKRVEDRYPEVAEVRADLDRLRKEITSKGGT